MTQDAIRAAARSFVLAIATLPLAGCSSLSWLSWPAWLGGPSPSLGSLGSSCS